MALILVTVLKAQVANRQVELPLFMAQQMAQQLVLEVLQV